MVLLLVISEFIGFDKSDIPMVPDSYSIEKVLDSSCKYNIDCETPTEFLIQSRCPFTSLCL